MSFVTMANWPDLKSDMIHLISFLGSYEIRAISSGKRTKIKYKVGD